MRRPSANRAGPRRRDHPTGRSSAITLPSRGRLPGAQQTTAPRTRVTAWSVAATEETINVVTAEPCVRQRAGGALGMEPSD